MKLLVFDTETTGTEEHDEVIELAWAMYCTEAKAFTSCTSVLIREYEAENKAMGVHGITDDMCKKNGAQREAVFLGFKHAVNKADFVVAHNNEFDIRLMKQSGFHFGKDVKHVCTINQIDWSAFSKARKLVHLAFDMGVIVHGAHRAINDVLMLCACLAKLDDLENQLIKTTWPQYEIFPEDPTIDSDTLWDAGFRWEKETRRRLKVDSFKDYAEAKKACEEQLTFPVSIVPKAWKLYLISVQAEYDGKDWFKQNGFFWNGENKTWCAYKRLEKVEMIENILPMQFVKKYNYELISEAQ